MAAAICYPRVGMDRVCTSSVIISHLRNAGCLFYSHDVQFTF